MNAIKTAKIVSLAIMASEAVYALIVFFIHRGNPAFEITASRNFDPAVFKGLYFAAAGIVLLILILKRTLFYSRAFIKLDREQILVKFGSFFIILNAISESIGILGLLMYFITGSFKHSMLLIAVSFIATILVYPFNYAISGYLGEIERKKQYSSY